MDDQGLHLLFDRSPIGIVRSRADGTITYANEALARLLGYTVGELATKNIERDIELDPEVRRRRIASHYPGMTLDGFETQWKTNDGRVVDVELWGHVTQTDGGPSFDASIIDITERKRARDELVHTTQVLDQVVRQMTAAYWLTDRDLRIMRTGGSLHDVLGVEPDGVIGRTVHEIQARAPASIDLIPFYERALAGEIAAFDLEFRDKHMTVIASPHRAGNGEIIGVVASALDITHSRMLERRMVDAQRAEGLGVLAGGLAHDFNNLLVAIIGNADLALREIPQGTPGRKALETIRDTGLRAAELTHQLLTVAGRGPAGTTRVYPAAIVDEIIRITAPSMPPSVQIEIDVPAALALRGDPAQLRQVVLNLIANARDALVGRDRGRILITARLAHHDGNHDPRDVISPGTGMYVELEVSDDGPGMTNEVRRHVFDPFFTTKEHGHGIGLAAVLGIVRAHGGGLRLVSAPGKGAAFAILWPAAVSAPSPIAMPPPPEARRTVLVIDDEDLVRDVVARMIEDLGYTAVTATDGANALEVFDRQPIDAVLVDMTMPRMSGTDVIAALRVKQPTLPVVLCSGAGISGRVGPADAYLPKPFRIEALERTLAKLLPS
ncbi:MAG TPA: PAS domain S-box protein [Kofleriaceae bacterium]|nr:PAS domain S-box protein [Kofleriaceae bacterium]